MAVEQATGCVSGEQPSTTTDRYVVQVTDTGVDGGLNTCMLIELDDLRKALMRNEIIPHFQPVVELRTGRFTGFEVLARWDHPLHGAFLPGNLIALAEEQVFAKAFAAVAKHPDGARLSVNLSPLQLSNPLLDREIEALAKAEDFDLSRLTLEVTESALLRDLERPTMVARALKGLGCHLSLDDFGTGYSSLAHLHALPFDELKIDRSFVAQMTKTRESRKIVAAIVGLGHSLGLRTVAEGIETQDQADMLVWLGCDSGQGWLYGRPAGFETFRGKAIGHAAATPKVQSPGDDWAVSSLEAFPTQRLAQLQAIYDGAPVGLCFLDSELRYVSLNKRLAEMNGFPVAEHLGRTVAEMVPNVYRSAAPYLARAMKGEAIAGVEFRRSHGESRPDTWNMCSYQPAFDEANEVIGISISVLDVTEHRQAQEELRETALQQHHLSELNRQTPWVMDAEGNNLQTSLSWVQGVPGVKEKARNLGWLEALHQDDLTVAVEAMRKALSTGEPIDMEYRVRNTEGEWRWMRSRGSPRFGLDGEITRWYGSVEDIHGKKLAEMERVRRAAKVRTLLEALPVAVIVGKERYRSSMKARWMRSQANTKRTPTIDSEKRMPKGGPSPMSSSERCIHGPMVRYATWMERPPA